MGDTEKSTGNGNGTGGAPAATAPAGTTQAPAAGKPPAAPPPVEGATGSKVFVKFQGENYIGLDGNDHVRLRAGDVAALTPAKAAQVLHDFPDEFRSATKVEYDKAQATLVERRRKLKAETDAREKKQAASSRARAMEDDDDAGDGADE